MFGVIHAEIRFPLFTALEPMDRGNHSLTRQCLRDEGDHASPLAQGIPVYMAFIFWTEFPYRWNCCMVWYLPCLLLRTPQFILEMGSVTSTVTRYRDDFSWVLLLPCFYFPIL